MVVSLALRAMKVTEGHDATVAADYHADDGPGTVAAESLRTVPPVAST